MEKLIFVWTELRAHENFLKSVHPRPIQPFACKTRFARRAPSYFRPSVWTRSMLQKITNAWRARRLPCPADGLWRLTTSF